LIVFKDEAAHRRRFHKYGDAGVKPGDIIFDGRRK